MKQKRKPRLVPPARQRGMALIVALIFLLLLTLIGLNSMQNSTLQEKMSSSVQFRNQSFQLAESALRLGETAVSKASYNLAVCGSAAACAPPSDAGSRDTAGQGTNALWVQAGTGGLYAVQRLGSTKGAIGCATSGSSTESQTLYRITGIGTVGTARTVLESIYAKNCS